MKTSNSRSVSPLASRLVRNEKLLAELREIAGRSPVTTNKTSTTTPQAETPFEIDGQEYAARLVSLSLGGGKLATDHEPPIGSLIRIGRITARVVGHLQDGIAIDFVDIED
ncbi:hypothetical protein [Vineibacter terrae]|uniref:hypothetical protein n=1 Tax=Vineibacter terrae TaxID=2586908 RepID=UPI002E35CFAF|nr:hypothetical protein [Vineibacter terrae]HEX2885668.1 hypothetical protein [Vineibacter terrae]